MAFKLEYYSNEMIDKTTNETIKKYNDFYGMDIKKSIIKIYIIKDRETFDEIKGYKTENWIMGHAKGTHIYLFDIDILEEVTGGVHKNDVSKYINTIKHEIAHSFYWLYLNGKYFYANRLNEGMAIYLSGQLSEKAKPENFECFLNYWGNEGKDVYKESGFVVQLLIEKYGKKRVLNLIKSLGMITTKEGFFIKFKEIFGFELNYDNINLKFKTDFNPKN